MSDTQQNEWRERELGGLWLESTDSGKKYFTGQVGERKVVVYKNDKWEEGGKMPYYRVYKSKPKTETAAAKTAAQDDGIPF